MPVRTADARWDGRLRDGKGKMKLGSGAHEGQFSFASRFENGTGTNPEELLGAAHAGCFSMALSAGLEKAGFNPGHVSTSAKVHIENTGGGFSITLIELVCTANVPGIDARKFQEVAEATKTGCPVSKALAATKIELKASLEA